MHARDYKSHKEEEKPKEKNRLRDFRDAFGEIRQTDSREVKKGQQLKRGGDRLFVHSAASTETKNPGGHSPLTVEGEYEVNFESGLWIKKNHITLRKYEKQKKARRRHPWPQSIFDRTESGGQNRSEELCGGRKAAPEGKREGSLIASLVKN